MSNNVIQIENLSKLYRLGEVGTGTLSHDLNRWWQTRILRNEDPYQKVGQLNDRTKKASKNEHIWALKDMNLEVPQGGILGIIGKNGAGKSTLLKLLSRVTAPTTGTIKTRGRLASLLEVGTGFHPEMTGRENIYMNGTIMGMRKHEISAKLDDIVTFAGVEKYLDTPTKRYSSGMTVRLGFAIAAFLEPEILVVDEVLAVGDAEFQKRAVGKMKDITSGEGRTVLFVSHNMASVGELCTSGMVLENGRASFTGKVQEAIELYLNGNVGQLPVIDLARDSMKLNRRVRGNEVKFKRISLLNHFRQPSLELFLGKQVYFRIEFEVHNNIPQLEIGVGIKNGLGVGLGAFASNWSGFKDVFAIGTHTVEIEIPFMYLTQGNYLVTFWLREHSGTRTIYDSLANCMEFTVTEAAVDGNQVRLHLNRGYNLTQNVNWKYIS